MINWQGGSDSERENYDASGFHELWETNQVKVQLSVSNEDHFNPHSVAASGGCLSSLRSLYYGKTILKCYCAWGAVFHAFFFFFCWQLASWRLGKVCFPMLLKELRNILKYPIVAVRQVAVAQTALLQRALIVHLSWWSSRRRLRGLR